MLSLPLFSYRKYGTLGQFCNDPLRVSIFCIIFGWFWMTNASFSIFLLLQEITAARNVRCLRIRGMHRGVVGPLFLSAIDFWQKNLFIFVFQSLSLFEPLMFNFTCTSFNYLECRYLLYIPSKFLYFINLLKIFLKVRQSNSKRYLWDLDLVAYKFSKRLCPWFHELIVYWTLFLLRPAIRHHTTLSDRKRNRNKRCSHKEKDWNCLPFDCQHPTKCETKVIHLFTSAVFPRYRTFDI